MRPATATRNIPPAAFSNLSSSFWVVLVLLIIPLLIFLLHYPSLSSSSSSDSDTTSSWKVGNSSSTISTSTSFFSLSAALSPQISPTSLQQYWPQPPAQAPLLSALSPAPQPQILSAAHDEVQDNIKVGNANKAWSSRQLHKLEARLRRARSSIRQAAKVRNMTSTHQDPDYVPRGPIYRNANAFHRSYLLMEKVFKMYVYEEGEVPLFHAGPCKSIYSSEGRFIHEMEKGQFYRTKDPNQAFVYFLPFSVVNMVQYLWDPHYPNDREGIKRAAIDYINVISHNHPFWNRSLGADHVMLSCHDWGPITSSFVPHLFHKSIRVLCNANTSEGFNPSKDASFPEINLRTGEMAGLGGHSPSTRNVLAFFAGRLHGHIRYLLFNEWKEKDQDVQVYEQLPKEVSYEQMLKKSRFCLCPSGYEVASPRVVEALYAECVPVLISDGYAPPFSDVLNWNSFSVQVDVKNISDIKNILMGISQRQYLRMQRRVKQVQRHFLVNGPPKRYDVFHMIVHSIWLRRLNIRIQDYLT